VACCNHSTICYPKHHRYAVDLNEVPREAQESSLLSFTM